MMGPTITWKDRTRCFLDACIAATLPGGLGLWRRLATVDGYLYPHEAVFLYQLAKRSPGSGSIVEIGSFLGRSTLCLAAGARSRNTAVVAVDPHVYGTERMFRDNLERFGVQERVVVEVRRSTDLAETWADPIRMVFIDGAHDEDSARADVQAWHPHVIPGGFVVLHDSTSLSGYPGPTAVADELLRVGSRFDLTGRIGSITWGRTPRSPLPWAPRRYGRSLDHALAVLKRIQRFLVRRDPASAHRKQR